MYQEKKIDKRNQLLRQGSTDISNTALTPGYDNAYHFSTAFKKAIGISPSEYREITGE